MPPKLVAVPDKPTIRILTRISKSDPAADSLEVQRTGAAAFAVARGWKLPTTVYESDGVAGDDVEGLVALQRLLDQVKPGDIVIARSHDRLGRDMLASASTIRAIIERGARLFYYSTGEEVLWRGATDSAMSVLRGFAGQAEVENIRARTKEALRQRVKAGKIAGGRCYGYANVQSPDEEGRRKNTVAVVDEKQAATVRRIFELYARGDASVRSRRA